MKMIALIAHDKKKSEMLEFVGHHKDLLKNFDLVATHTTGKLINDTFNLNVQTMMSGPWAVTSRLVLSLQRTKSTMSYSFAIH